MNLLIEGFELGSLAAAATNGATCSELGKRFGLSRSGAWRAAKRAQGVTQAKRVVRQCVREAFHRYRAGLNKSK